MTLAIHDAFREWLTTTTLADRQSFHVLLQVEVYEFEDEVQLVAVGVDDVEKAEDIGVVHLFEEGDFANGSGRDALILSLEADLLESDDAVVGRGEVAGFVDDAVRACRRLCVLGLAIDT